MSAISPTVLPHSAALPGERLAASEGEAIGAADSLAADTPPERRLEASRRRLRDAMARPTPHPFVDATRAATQAASRAARDASRTTLEPMVREHPLGAAAAAAAVGALLVWSRPWRWIGSALLVGVLPRVASRVIANLPYEAWLKRR